MENTRILTVCDGQIKNGFCSKCWQPAQTTSNYCGRFIEPPTIATDSTTPLKSSQEPYRVERPSEDGIVGTELSASQPVRSAEEPEAVKVLRWFIGNYSPIKLNAYDLYQIYLKSQFKESKQQ